MKKTIKMLGIIALTMFFAFSMSGCDNTTNSNVGGGGKTTTYIGAFALLTEAFFDELFDGDDAMAISAYDIYKLMDIFEKIDEEDEKNGPGFIGGDGGERLSLSELTAGLEYFSTSFEPNLLASEEIEMLIGHVESQRYGVYAKKVTIVSCDLAGIGAGTYGMVVAAVKE